MKTLTGLSCRLLRHIRVAVLILTTCIFSAKASDTVSHDETASLIAGLLAEKKPQADTPERVTRMWQGLLDNAANAVDLKKSYFALVKPRMLAQHANILGATNGALLKLVYKTRFSIAERTTERKVAILTRSVEGLHGKVRTKFQKLITDQDAAAFEFIEPQTAVSVYELIRTPYYGKSRKYIAPTPWAEAALETYKVIQSGQVVERSPILRMLVREQMIPRPDTLLITFSNGSTASVLPGYKIDIRENDILIRLTSNPIYGAMAQRQYDGDMSTVKW
jgi:hypothetical protein